MFILFDRSPSVSEDLHRFTISRLLIVQLNFQTNFGKVEQIICTRWFKYDRDWFVCKQAALRSSCATLRE